MPGKRCLARERAQHDVASRLAETYALVHRHFPDRDRVLIGPKAILEYLASLGLRRPNGGPVTWRMVLRWHRSLSFPLLTGGWLARSGSRVSPVSTELFVTAWMLSQFNGAQKRAIFAVVNPQGLLPVGKRPTDPDMRKRARAGQREMAA